MSEPKAVAYLMPQKVAPEGPPSVIKVVIRGDVWRYPDNARNFVCCRFSRCPWVIRLFKAKHDVGVSIKRGRESPILDSLRQGGHAIVRRPSNRDLSVGRKRDGGCPIEE